MDSCWQGDWHAQRDVGLRSAVEYTLRRAQRHEIAEVSVGGGGMKVTLTLDGVACLLSEHKVALQGCTYNPSYEQWPKP